MGMSTNVVGFKPPDARWQKLAKIYNACVEADFEIPEEIGEFFGWDTPDPQGVEVDLSLCLTKLEKEYQDGYELRITDIPKGVTVLRFYNSY